MAAIADPPPGSSTSGAGLTDYWHAARRPLQVLVFLAPLIVAYELCLALLLQTGDGLRVNTVEAHKTLLTFFTALGVAPTGGLYLGGIVMLVVLLAWHVLARERWRVEGSVLLLMAIEVLIWTVPLLLLSHLIAARPELTAAPTGPTFAQLDLPSRMAISVGAGLYEELVFRMIIIAMVHTLLVDLGKASELTGSTIAVLVSAAAFTFYHQLRGPDGAISTRKVLFFSAAGLYFGTLFLLRGFGIVVGVHALYDIVTVILTAPDD